MACIFCPYWHHFPLFEHARKYFNWEWGHICLDVCINLHLFWTHSHERSWKWRFWPKKCFCYGNYLFRLSSSSFFVSKKICWWIQRHLVSKENFSYRFMRVEVENIANHQLCRLQCSKAIGWARSMKKNKQS